MLLPGAIPTLVAVLLDGPALGLVAGAGLLWTAGVWVATHVPIVRSATGLALNERIAAALSLAAAATAAAGIVMVTVALL